MKIKQIDKFIYSTTSNKYIEHFLSLLDIPIWIENDLLFEATNVMSFSNYLKSNALNYIKFIYDIGLIINHLHANGESILNFHYNDFIVINKGTFVFINIQKILPIHNKYITLTTPLTISYEFMDPTINIQKLPIKCHYTNCYYSFALLLEKTLGRVQEHDKLFYFLEKAKRDPIERLFLYL